MNEMGFLTWWTVPDVSATYSDLVQLAGRVGLPSDCVPNPPSARHAWEKATNVGGQRGLKLRAAESPDRSSLYAVRRAAGGSAANAPRLG